MSARKTCVLASALFYAFLTTHVLGQDDAWPMPGDPSATLEEPWTPASSVEGQQVVQHQIDEAFVLEVEAALGAQLLDNSRERVADMLKALRPSFESMEKNEYGKLEHTAVRYALHRLFVTRHGWLMKGLNPAGQSFNSSSPVEVLKNKTSLHVQGIFEKRLGGQGFGLQELAVFASVLETLISMEVTERIEDLFYKFHIPLDSKLTEEQLTHLMEVYMTAFILGKDIESLSQRILLRLKDKMQVAYQYWGQARKFVHDLRVEALGNREEYTSMDMRAVLVRVGESFGKWQNTECQEMKQRLTKLENGEQGCVPIASFYRGALETGGKDWQFQETMEYLKANGIIDESEQGNPKVMVSNYMNAPVNCIAFSYYYAVCCIDECESLLGHIERRVQAPTGDVEEIAALIAALPSTTVPGNRTLPPSQLHRLRRIADMHGGRVPIHGRLFMQWMHMVYPRECAYPHISGTTKPVTPDVWTAQSHKTTAATLEEMKRYVNVSLRTQAPGNQGQCGRWVDEEELLVGVPSMQKRQLHELETDFHTWVAASSVAFMCILAATTLAVIQTAKNMRSALCGSTKQKLKQHERHELMLV
jgi:hypothetical protein